MKTKQEQIAWAAGIFEGEGCFSCRKSNNRKDGRKKDRSLTARLKMSDEDVIRAFHNVVGVGHINGPYTKAGRKTIWIWQSGCYKDVKYVMDIFYPYLFVRRRQRIDELLQWYIDNAPKGKGQ